MSKKKTEAEMRAIAEMIKNMVKDWNEDETEDEAEKTHKENYPNNNCEDCEYWDVECDCCDGDCEEEDSEEEDYRYPECECVDGECDQCEHWVYNDYCELDDEGEDCEEEEEEEEEHTQTENLSKFITSVGTVLGGDMGLLVFDKSNKKDMEKIAAIFEEYVKRL